MVVVVIFLFILSMIFLVLGYMSKREWDEGAASVNYAIGVLLLIADIILFVIMIGTNHLYEKNLDSGMLYFICGSGMV